MKRIAMWSGPRNISTAMMRAWENRGDAMVVDEPFYAFYLNKTHADHPGADEVISSGETNWERVVAQLAGPIPNEKQILYSKQMTHHLLPEVSREWMLEMTNCFLIRDPARVIASYTRKNHEPSLADLGFVQQADIFDFVRQHTGEIPPVIDADDVLRDSKKMLALLCEAIGVDFTERMLSWPPGRRASDGVWAQYWYAEVERSTSFAPYREIETKTPPHLREIEQRCREIYNRLKKYRINLEARKPEKA